MPIKRKIKKVPSCRTGRAVKGVKTTAIKTPKGYKFGDFAKTKGGATIRWDKKKKRKK